VAEAKGFAVIGTGLWGSLHARVYAESEKARLVAVCDLDRSRAEEAARGSGAAVYTDHREMLERESIDAISIVTPDFAHVEPVLDAIAAGKHVLVEKPLAMTSAECERIIGEARKSRVKLMVDFHNRWSPPFYNAKTSIERGDIGPVKLIYYRLSDTIYVPTQMLSWASRTTVQWFIGSHALDTVRWMIGDEVSYVYAVARSGVLSSRGVDTPDFYQAVLEFRSGAVAVVENCWILPTSIPNLIDLKCEVVGTEGALYVDTSHNRTMEHYTADRGEYPDVLVLPQVHGKQIGFAAESIRHFIDCVVDDLGPLATGEDGLAVTRMIEAIEESAAGSVRVSVAG